MKEAKFPKMFKEETEYFRVENTDNNIEYLNKAYEHMISRDESIKDTKVLYSRSQDEGGSAFSIEIYATSPYIVVTYNSSHYRDNRRNDLIAALDLEDVSFDIFMKMINHAKGIASSITGKNITQFSMCLNNNRFSETIGIGILHFVFFTISHIDINSAINTCVSDLYTTEEDGNKVINGSAVKIVSYKDDEFFLGYLAGGFIKSKKFLDDNKLMPLYIFKENDSYKISTINPYKSSGISCCVLYVSTRYSSLSGADILNSIKNIFAITITE